MATLGVLCAGFVILVIAESFSSPYQPEDLFDMKILPDAEGNTDILSSSTPVILRVDITGVIGMPEFTADVIDSYLRASRKGLFHNNRVKALLLYINSPGGTALDSDLIHASIQRYKAQYKIPVFAYTPGFCASGGYMIACAADRILAAESAIIGSVGVKWGLGLNVFDLMQKHGVQSVTLTAGLDKEKYPTFTKANPSGYADLATIVNDSYTQFIELVAKNRKDLSAQALRTTYGARVFIAETAKAHGYVDEAGVLYADALSALAKEAQLEKYQVVRCTIRQSPFRSLLTSKLSLWLDETRAALFGLPSEGRLNHQLLYHYDPIRH